jgi:SAM-dependent methyltransferase
MARLTDMASYMLVFAVRVVADLGVADELADGPLPVEELARRTNADLRSLDRVMRALACKDVFEEVACGVYGLTSMSQLLRSDHPMSLRAGMSLIPADVQAWARFDHSVRTGESAFRYVHGVDYWTYMSRHPGESERFDRSQQTMTTLEVQALLRTYPWTGVEQIVDLGGGNGAFLAGILARTPGVRGVLVDFPHVVAGADEVLAGANVADRCEVVGASFLEHVPAGADVYVLKRIAWGHPDATLINLFTRIREAMRPQGRLLILEPGIHDGPEFTHGKIQDLRFLALGGGGARTPDEMSRLLRAAGLELAGVTPTSVISIVEARAAA